MIEVRPATAGELDVLLPLVADYQRFYGVAAPEDDCNRAFFGGLLTDTGRGRLLGAWDGGRAVGFATLQWSWDTISASDVAVLYDLFVAEAGRGQGTGRALLQAAAALARSRGYGTLQWSTALDNRRAQALYERTGAERSAWFEYALDLRTQERPGQDLNLRPTA